jgi:pyrroloquinoline quinone biosynthesis protein B
LRVRLLGTAAGGGVPQWNCACEVCALARAGDPRVAPRTQTSVALTVDGERWVVLDASPDLRQQLAAAPALAPRPGATRGSPVAAVLLTSAEVDHVAGLLSLREGSFALYATAAVLAELEASRIFEALDRARVPRRVLRLDEPTIVRTVSGDPLTEVLAFAVPGKVPLYRERAGADPAARLGEDTIALRVGPLAYVPSCGAVTPALLARLEGARLVLFDGTCWADDDLAAAGAPARTARRMGHQPLGGDDGALAALAGVAARRRLVHLNNTNPALVDDGAARRAVRALGWEVASDGEEHQL